MLLDVIRHGATATNAAGRFNTDDEALLRSEVQRLRAAAIPGHYDLIYVSPLRRCIETAEALGLSRFETDARLRERHFGVFAGLTPAECMASFPEAFGVFARFDAAFAPDGGESRAEHVARIWAWLEDVCRRAPARALAITHGGTLDFLYRQATGRDLHGGSQIYAGENAALSSFRVEWPQLELIGFSQPLVP